MNDTTQPEKQALADTLLRANADAIAPGMRAEPRSRSATLATSPGLPMAPDAASSAGLENAVEAATQSLLDAQRPDGHWLYELEADATIPAEYVLLVHHLAEKPDVALEAKIAVYLRRIQGAHGGWPLFHDGPLDISASVKAYFALKMIGDAIDAPHMRRAREAILAHGGAAGSNVFTRILLALYGVLSWRAVPMMPIEIVLLPRWFPFHLSKISYWARTVIVPLLVLQLDRPRARNPRGVRLDELFVEPAVNVGLAKHAPHQNRHWFRFFRVTDVLLRATDWLMPASLRERAKRTAVEFVSSHLNGEDGLGAIYPAMANLVMMFDALGYPPEHPQRAIARRAIDRLLVIRDDEAYCQPCLSPVWDTALAAHALLESGTPAARRAALAGAEWLRPLQILETAGDWSARRPDVRPGGWAFQYANDHYPDVDDTAVVVMAMDRLAGTADYTRSISRGREWVLGMQSSEGGWGAFEPENTHEYLNNIPFADHGALLDPPTVDVSARCLSMLTQLGASRDDPAVARVTDYLLTHQEANGSWHGRWGMNYIYGTWAALCALNGVGIDAHGSPLIRRSVDWLFQIQNADGGWGEDGDSYRLDYRGHASAPSTASQTAWALLGLMSAGVVDDARVARGVAYLIATQNRAGFWDEPRFTATGFPRVFYLRYHGYAHYFPLWALARYRNLRRAGTRHVAYGL
ncbi:squalene--hopene cyclase [Robbsia betulipollinis]